MNEHVRNKHQANRSTMCNECKNLKTLERNYEVLKENYERLVTINKNIQEEAKHNCNECDYTQLKQKISS